MLLLPSPKTGITSKKKVKTIRLTLPPLHPHQRQFVNDQHRVVVAACGSKFGKTFGLCIWLLAEAWNKKQSLNWWCAPTIRQATNAFNQIGWWLPPGRFKVNRQERCYWLLGDDGKVRATIEFRSADHPESLRGDGVHAAVVDEACYWKEDSYISVWTTLTRTMGKLRVISTPKGKTWFYEEWLKGWEGDGGRPDLRAKFPEFASYQFPTWVNPTVKPEAIDMLRRKMTKAQFQQEIEAKFLDDAAGAFKNLEACQRSRLRKNPIRGQQYILGIDWAKHMDYTVFVVLDYASKEVVHLERHNDTDWNVNIKRALQCAEKWNKATMIIDATGIGDVIYDQIRAVYPYLYGYSISTNERKVRLVQRLQLAFEKTELLIPRPEEQETVYEQEEARQLLHELRMYNVEYSGQGRLIFGAPEGYHDDYVIGLGLVNWLANEDQEHYRAMHVSGV